LVLLNQDTRVDEGWLDGLASACQAPQIGVVGCKALYPGRERVQHAGGQIEWPLGRGSHLGAGEPDGEAWNHAGPADYVSGASMAFRRDVLDEVGLLDERFYPGYYEDVDFCYRVRNAGYEVWYTPQACLIHDESTALSGTRGLHVALNRGRLLFVLKHLPPERFVAEFVPAERAWLLPMARSELGQVHRRLYLEIMPAAAAILVTRWRCPPAMVRQVLKGLEELYECAATESPVVEYRLEELAFASSAPLVGPAIAWLRKIWYNVAARWAVRHLAEQQQAINRATLRRIEEQERATAHAVHSVVALSEELARVIGQLEARAR
jgi:hypothetical protein